MDKIKHILDNNSIFSFISRCLSSLLFQKTIIIERTILATSIKKRNIKNVILIEGSLPQLIILIVEIRNINRNTEAQIYNRWTTCSLNEINHSLFCLNIHMEMEQCNNNKSTWFYIIY